MFISWYGNAGHEQRPGRIFHVRSQFSLQKTFQSNREREGKRWTSDLWYNLNENVIACYYYCCLDEVRNIASSPSVCLNTPARPHWCSLFSTSHIYHHFQRAYAVVVLKKRIHLYREFSTRSSDQIGIQNLFFWFARWRKHHHSSSQRKCCSTFSISTRARFFFSSFSGGTFINHLILWNKKQPARSVCILRVSEWVSVYLIQCEIRNSGV